MAVIALISIGIWSAWQNNENTVNTAPENTTTKPSLASSSPGDCLQLSDATELVLENNEPKDIHPSDYKKKICFFENKVISEIVESDGEYVQEEFVKWDKVYKRFIVTRGRLTNIFTFDDVNQGIAETWVRHNFITKELEVNRPHVYVFKHIEKTSEGLKPQSEVKFIESDNVVGIIEGAEKYILNQHVPDIANSKDNDNNPPVGVQTQEQSHLNDVPPQNQPAQSPAKTENAKPVETENQVTATSAALIQYDSPATPLVIQMIDAAWDTEKLFAAKNSLTEIGRPAKGDRKAARKLNDTVLP